MTSVWALAVAWLMADETVVDPFIDPAERLMALTWYANWAWGLPLIVMCVLIHIIGLDFINRQLKRVQSRFPDRDEHHFAFLTVLSTAVLLATLLHGIEAMIWAVAFRLLDALPGYHSAILYSLNAITTFGHTTFTLNKHWELLGALEALNGMLLFGFTTAFLINILQRRSGLNGGESK